MNASHRNSMLRAGLLAAVLLAGLTACTEQKAQESAPQTPKEEVVPVVAEPVRFEPFSITKNYTGTLEGERQASLIAKVTEQIVEIPVSIGQVVNAGQVLVRLDRSGPSSRYHQAESAFLNAERSAKRMEALFETGAISRQALDDVKTSLDVARAEFESAKSLVDLTSPIRGTVTAIDYSVGDVTAPGLPVATVAVFERMQIVFHVSESDLQFLQLGLPVNIYSELRKDLIRQGEITSLARSADVSTRTFEAKAEFDNTEDHWFRPGMFAVAQILYTTPEAVTFIPRAALVHGESGDAVFVVNGDKVSRKPVATGMNNNEFIIVSGLVEGEQVVTMGINQLDDGAKITLVDAARFSVSASFSSENAQ